MRALLHIHMHELWYKRYVQFLATSVILVLFKVDNLAKDDTLA